MNKERVPNSLDDLPILTEVVVPSPASVKARVPRTTTATAPQASQTPQTPQIPQTPASPAATPSSPPASSLPRAEPADNAALPTLNPDLAALSLLSDMRETLAEIVRKQASSEIPSLVEAALQNALPIITQEIQEGLEESLKQALKKLLLEIREKTQPATIRR